jgi:serpin B
MRLFLCLLSCSLFFTFCSKEVIQDKLSTPNEKGKLDESISKSLSEGAFRLFDYTNKNSDAGDNVIISPLSMQFAIGMADNGAKGNTLAQLMDINLQDAAELPSLNDHFAFLYHALTKNQNGVKVSLSNGVFFDKQKVNIYDSYPAILQQYFAPDIESLNFKDVPATLNTINGWVKNATNSKIEKVLDDISDDEFMFLINALYMKADWDHPFAPELTHKADFKTSTGAVVSADFMNQRLDANFLTNESMDVVSLPLGKGQLSAVFIMPKKKDISSFISQDFNESLFDKIATTARTSDMIVTLPKVKMTQKFDLKAILQSMGVIEPFTAQADFSGIAGRPGDVYLTRALHDVFLQIDEKGIEGAAVTTIGVGVTSMPPSLTFNQPYVFAIRDNATGTNLFLGKIVDPTKNQ